MPVNRAYISGYAVSDTQAYQALTALADFSDRLEQSMGVLVGTGTAATLPAPPAAQLTIAASEGHYVVQITNPSSATAPVQHELRSSSDLNFNVNSSLATFTLGLGQTSLDVVDPNVPRYWQIRSRYQGSAWTGWRTYANSNGVQALNAGVLRTA